MLDVFRQSVMITSFVTVMMLVIEYINVITEGKWQKLLSGSRWKQYFIAAFLGVTPGCLGAFAVVALYQHGIVSMGAVVAAMIATAGDESFVMLAMIPGKSPLIFGIIFLLGILAGAASDIYFRRSGTEYAETGDILRIHPEHKCNCFPSRAQMVSQWKNPGASRCIMSVVLFLVAFAVITGDIGPVVWNWVRVTLFIVVSTALFIVTTVPEHFLNSHLWEHVFKEHVPTIFLWTFGALFFLDILISHIELEALVQQNLWIILIVAALVGIIPESGPHLIFVTLYAKGVIPFSVLLASTIVQDGHGMIPLLARSRRDFMVVKCINLIVGLSAGALLMFLGH